MQPADIECPAGELRGECSVYCSVETQPIDGRLNPDSVQAFCAGAYTACPTWIAEKERIAAANNTPLAEQGRNDRVRAFDRKVARQQRLQRAQELMYSDTPEGRRFRRRLGLAEVLPRGVAA